MAQEQKPGYKSRAIRDFLAENPGASPSRIAEALAAAGIEVPPAFVATVRELESTPETTLETQNATVRAPFLEGLSDTERAFPAVSKWVKDYGWIEVGVQEHQGFLTRALDEGGMVCEANECSTLAEALAALNEVIRDWLSRQ